MLLQPPIRNDWITTDAREQNNHMQAIACRSLSGNYVLGSLMKRIYRMIGSGLTAENRWKFGRDGIGAYHLIANTVPRNMPEAFWRSISGLRVFLRVTIVLAFFFVLVTLAVLIFPDVPSIHVLERYSSGGFAVAIVLHSCFGIFGFRIACGRFRRFLNEHAWRICYRCGYILSGLPPQHRCPECDLPYELSKLEKKWKRWINRQIVYTGMNERHDAGASMAENEKKSNLLK